MANAKHTPAPWTVGRGRWQSLVAVYHECIYIAHAETGVGKDWIGVNPIGEERGRANARLIAASPELFESVVELLALVRLKYGNLHPDTNAIQAKAEAAIAKAKGEQP